MTTTSINQQKEKNMSTTTNNSPTNEKKTMNTSNNITKEIPMNLFDDIAVTVQERKNAGEWTLDDCKKNLKVIFRECSEADTFIVSINLGGLTSLKIFNGKTTFKMKKGLMGREEMLARVIDEDVVIEEARGRMIQSLRKAKQSRETTKARKERELENLNKQQMLKLSTLQQKASNNKEKESLKDRIDLASLMSEVEEIESNQALTRLLPL
jgi:hypothetical protein